MYIYNLIQFIIIYLLCLKKMIYLYQLINSVVNLKETIKYLYIVFLIIK